MWASILAFSLLASRTVAAPVEDENAKILEARQRAPPGGIREGRFTFYEMPTPLSGICDLCKGPDGALWGVQMLVNQIVRVDQQTGVVEEFPIPFSPGVGNITIPGLNTGLIQDRLALSCAIRPGADGKIYATNSLRNQLVQLNVDTKEMKLFQAPVNPAGNLFPFNDIFTDHDGMWMTQTTANVLQFFDYAAQAFTLTVLIPTPGALPLGVFVTSDGGVYGCEILGNNIFEYNRTTGEMKEYPLPLPLQAPAVNRAERNGFMYFSLFTGNGIGRINLKTKEIELFPSGQPLSLGSVTAGPSKGGAVWMSFFATTNALMRFGTRGKISFVEFPDTFAERFGFEGLLGNVPPYLDISVEYGPGNALWFGSYTRNAIGRYQL